MAELLELSPDVLEWAARQVGRSLREIAQKISNRHAERIVEGKLSPPQAAKFANLTGTPFGYLFLDTPPFARALPIADFRTLPTAAPLSKNFFDTYDDIDFKQSWFRDFLIESGAESLPFIGRFNVSDDPIKVAADMRVTLDIADSDFARLRSADEVFSMLTAKAEAVGILVFKNSIVGSNHTRPLSVSEFRGFVISDNIVPAVFINGADAPAAWVFTLSHEFAHIWIGDSGVSDAAPNSDNRHERFCNAIAAEFLVPRASFLDEWEIALGGEDAKLEHSRRTYKVSALVIARRAFDLGLISRHKYQTIYEETRLRAAKPRPSGGGDYYRTLAVRNSKSFTNRVARLAASGTISFREAGQLLNTNPNNVMTYYAKQRALLA
jgi:Zn-dependent peptidase ImmA (M78 family)